MSFVLQSYIKSVFMRLLFFVDFFFFFSLERIKELQCYSSNLVSDI